MRKLCLDVNSIFLLIALFVGPLSSATAARYLPKIAGSHPVAAIRESFILPLEGSITLSSSLYFLEQEQLSRPNKSGRLQTTPESPLMNGYLQGQVIDDRSGQPIRYATILVNDKVLTTDSQGRFNLVLPRGYYQLTIEHPDYLPKQSEPIFVSSGRRVEIQSSLSDKLRI